MCAIGAVIGFKESARVPEYFCLSVLELEDGSQFCLKKGCQLESEWGHRTISWTSRPNRPHPQQAKTLLFLSDSPYSNSASLLFMKILFQLKLRDIHEKKSKSQTFDKSTVCLNLMQCHFTIGFSKVYRDQFYWQHWEECYRLCSPSR